MVSHLRSESYLPLNLRKQKHRNTFPRNNYQTGFKKEFFGLFSVSCLIRLRRNTGIPTYHQCSGVAPAHQSQPLHGRGAGEHLPTPDGLQLLQPPSCSSSPSAAVALTACFQQRWVSCSQPAEAVTALHS